MENTGRILRGLTPTARNVLFDAAVAAVPTELNYITQVDQAHLVMLAECGLIDWACARKILKAIEELRATDFAALTGRLAPRGLYLLYEDYLIEKLGPQVGGILQTGRSRNDLGATVLRMRLRDPFIHLISESLKLQAVLMRRARRYADVTMPAYTHYQAAVPTTYGHYLAGIAQALERDVRGIFEADTDLNRCPLGACAVGGTTLAIDPSRTASLLGFEETTIHSIDAVASRDVVLRLLASATILGITLSRVANDLLLWSTAEFGFISLPDELVGSSSLMPQKRNPFLLEHIQGRSASPLGAFVAASTAMHAMPFTNSIAVSTEATSHIWKTMREVTEAVILTRLVIAGAVPERQSMLRKAVDGYTSATELANRLVLEGQMSFRSAHHKVGEIIREAVDNGGEPLEQIVAKRINGGISKTALEGLGPSDVAMASIYGGGPGIVSINTCLDALQDYWSVHMKRKRAQTRKWFEAKMTLEWVAQSASL